MFKFVSNLSKKCLTQKSLRNAVPKTKGSNVDYFDIAKMVAVNQKERRYLRENPPICGALLRYTQQDFYKEIHGTFLFRSDDVEQEIKYMLRGCSRLNIDDEGAMFNWVQGRDKSLAAVTDIPTTWSRFKFVAKNLVRAGKGTIYCKKCKTAIATDQITTNNDHRKYGWLHDRLVCPHGHCLLVVDTDRKLV